MKNRAKWLVPAVYLLLLVMSASAACAWGTYPSFPNTFMLNGEEHLFPCELLAFICDNWEVYDMNTDDYLQPYEEFPADEERDLYLVKGNQRLFITLKNQIGHELTIVDCDVTEIRVSNYSFSPFDTPDIEFFGIRPGMDRKKLPDWFQKERDFSADGVDYQVFPGLGNSMLMLLNEENDYEGSIYYSWDKQGKIDYFCISIDSL